MTQIKKVNRFWVLLPTFGTLIFVILYIIATFLYPGGSQVDKNSIGFSWINNYWCNLLNENAINGQPNSARFIALLGMFVLCLTLSSFWLLFPSYTNFKNWGKLIIQISGIIAMAIGMFLFTKFHDAIINLAGLFGLIALCGTFIGLYKNKWYGLFYFGILNLLLIGLNNYVYYTKGLMIYLPIVQKLTFLSYLIWVCSMDIKMYSEKNNS